MTYLSLFVSDANGTTLELIPVAWLHEDGARCNHVEAVQWCSNPGGRWLPLYKIKHRKGGDQRGVSRRSTKSAHID